MYVYMVRTGQSGNKNQTNECIMPPMRAELAGQSSIKNDDG